MKSDRRSFVFSFVLLSALWGGVLLVERCGGDEKEGEALANDSIADSVYLWRQTYGKYERRDSFDKKDKKERWYAVPEKKVETFPFDPNTADSTIFLRLGLPPYMVRNIYKYRAKGGRYHQTEDFKRIYGMTPELWKRLGPMIRIGEDYRFYPKDTARTHRFETDSSSSRRRADTTQWIQKYKERVQLDANRVDTNTLKRIPGIGSVLSRRIVRYREELGGFSSDTQLSEIEGLPDSIGNWLKIKTGVYRQIPVNRADFSTLRRHPYMSVEKTKVIMRHRRLHGELKSLDDLRMYPEFTEADLQRLAPYLTF